MPKFCSNCGTQIQEGEQFCKSCGNRVQDTTPPQQQTPPPQYPSQQQVQTQTYVPMPPQQKSNTSIIIAAVAIIIVIIVVAAVAFLLMGSDGTSSNTNGNTQQNGGASDQFLGEWEQDAGYGMSVIWDFKIDGSLEVGSAGVMMDIGDWSITGGQLCLDASSVYGGFGEGSSCVDYAFSDGGNTLTLTQSGVSPVVLTKS